MMYTGSRCFWLGVGLLAVGATTAASAAPPSTQLAPEPTQVRWSASGIETTLADGRLKLAIDPEEGPILGQSPVETATQFIAAHRARLLGPDQESTLAPSRVQESLLATHVHFQQLRDGLPVRLGEVVVSVSHQDGSVMKVYNSAVSSRLAPGPKGPRLSSEAALDRAWQNLRVFGRLISAPKSTLNYVATEAGLRLAYTTRLNVEGPFGYWEQQVDAHTGEIFGIRDTRIQENKVRAESPPRFDPPLEPRLDRRQASLELGQRLERAGALKAEAIAVDGTGVVFDPDPRTTLVEDSLEDASPDAAFTDAYLLRPLMDISVIRGKYLLRGPWVKLGDFEPPRQRPSVSSDGNWTAHRGDNAFNDAVTYFHLDQNQRYIQSLGYQGSTGIQDGPISVDTDGVNGTDNSHYSPGTNAIAFGHGCVDDNEDADVILHEYGHGITYAIAPNWGGGDTGAMGEGFGDYWAGSYSYSTPNGPEYHPEWVFSWDGHSDCWSGRVMDRLDATYDPNVTYGAHQNMGGYQSDELWSTPLFQSLLELTDLGIPREEVDQIVLESFFGSGANMSMRDMAIATVAAAEALYPAGPHAQVFIDHFAAQNILPGG